MKPSASRVVLTALSFALACAAQAQVGSPRATVKSRRVHASQAPTLLGGSLRTLAAQHRRSETGMRNLLQRDQDLWLDPQARLVYHCEAHAPAEDVRAGSAAAGPYAYEDTFRLHSRPGSSRKVFLDFDGHTAVGTWWNEDTGGAPIVSAPFNTDGSPDFSASELDAVQYAWQRVAEDFAPFDVDVTTEDPGVDGLRRTSSADAAYGVRVVISPTDEWFGNSGGVAYLSVFSMVNTGNDLPAYVFSANLSNSEKNIAEASSHEAGHTLGLAHDGKTGVTYFSGVSGSDWAPIMGSGYYKSVTQWSRGEYSGANNPEDDFVMMGQNGAALHADDHGDAPATATFLAGTNPASAGVIEQRTDRDYFRFDTGAGSITVTANPGPRGANLDIQIELFAAGGALLTSVNPAGLGATLTRTVPAGAYYVAVDGAGVGDPVTTGYSDYASVGHYTLGAVLVGGTGSSVTLTAPNGGENLTAGAGGLITWASSGTVGSVKLEYSTNGGASWILLNSGTANDGAEPWTVPAIPTTQGRVRVATVDGLLQDTSNGNFTISAPATASITVTSPNGGESWAVGTARTVTWASANVTGNVEIQYSTNGGGAWTSLASGSPNDGLESWVVPNTPGPALVRVAASNGAAADQSDNAFTITGPLGDAFEADDAPETARGVNPGETQNRSIHAAGNADWVRFTLTVKSRVTLVTAGTAGGDTVLSLYKSNGRLVVSNDNYVTGSGYSRIGDRTLGAGTYYAQVIGNSGTIQAYTLAFSAQRSTKKRP